MRFQSNIMSGPSRAARAKTRQRREEVRVSRKTMQKMVDAWNATYPIGTPVSVTRDSGAILETVTRSQAELSSTCTPVIFVNGIAGYYRLDRVRPKGGDGA